MKKTTQTTFENVSSTEKIIFYEKEIEFLAGFLMDEFAEEMTGNEGAIEMATRLLNEYKYRDGVIGKNPDGKKMKTK